MHCWWSSRGIYNDRLRGGILGCNIGEGRTVTVQTADGKRYEATTVHATDRAAPPPDIACSTVAHGARNTTRATGVRASRGQTATVPGYEIPAINPAFPTILIAGRRE